MKSLLQITLLIAFALFSSINVQGQSITVNLSNYPSYCAGSIIDVPVTLSGNFGSNNVFKLKLKTKNYGGSPDSTFYVQASNSVSPLKFQLPKLYSKSTSSGIYTYDLSVEATNPIILSNIVIVQMNFLPQVQLLVALNSQGYTFPRDEYMNPNVGKRISVNIFAGVDDNSFRFKLNDSLTYSGFIFVNPPATFTYSIAKVWNSCGIGRILGSNVETVKVNPFKIKIATVLPTNVCEDKKVKIKFDYVGSFNSNNQFLMDLTNAKGDTLTTLTTITEDSTNIYAILPNSLSANFYRVRVRATSPEAASSYFQIKVLPKPRIEFVWIPPYPEPIAYNYPMQLRLNLYGTNFGVVKPTFIKFSDGTSTKNFGYFTGVNSGYLSDVYFDLKPNLYYKIDSLVTTCGVLRDYTVTGERSWNVKDDFYIHPLPKRVYCEGEQIKFKIKSNFAFGQNNNFTINFYDTYRILIITLPVSVVGDSLVATVPILIGNGFNSGLTFTITSTQPQMTSAFNWDYFTINKKPEFRLLSSSTTTLAPALISIQGFAKGINPLTLIVNNGVEDKIYKFNNYSQGNEERIGSINIFASKSQNIFIKKIENICGNSTFSPPINHSIIVTNPYPNYMVFTNSNELNNLCLGNSYLAKFDTIGRFTANNIFIITLKINGIDYEIGRGNKSPISINIPPNLPIGSNTALFGDITLSASTISLSNQQNVERTFNTTITSNHTLSFYSVVVNGNYVSQEAFPINKTIKILKNDKVTLSLNSNKSISYSYKINGKWFYQINETGYGNIIFFDIETNKDTTLILESVSSFCGTFLVRDTLIIKVKKFRILSSVALTSDVETTNLCQGDKLEVFFGIEGEIQNRPIDYKIYITVNNSLLELPIITKKVGSYIVKIPDFPYYGGYRITILPSTSNSDFASYFYTPRIYIDRKVNVKLTGMDDSEIGWYDENATWAYIKATQINTQGVSWWAKLEEINTQVVNNISYQSPIITVNKSSSIFKIKDVESACGYGLGIGQVTLKRCYDSLNLPSYFSYITDREIYSNGYINFFGNLPFISPYFKTLLSAKTFSEFLPGFEVNKINTQSFTVEQKGCVVTR